MMLLETEVASPILIPHARAIPTVDAIAFGSVALARLLVEDVQLRAGDLQNNTERIHG
jgi:hypothetical protein